MKLTKILSAIVTVLACAFLMTGPWSFDVSAAGAQFFKGNDVLHWEHDGLDVAGNPEKLGDYEVGLFTGLNVNPNAAGVTPIKLAKILSADACKVGATPLSSICEKAFSSVLPAIPDGDYTLSIRVYDLAGNVSDWATPFSGTLDTTKPKPPANWGCSSTKNS